MPTRNRRALLRMALHSALRQRDVSLEVLVVDEGSTDDTPAMLAALADTRVRVIRHDAPQGVSTARNHGAAEARGEWLAFLDDDDLWAPDKLTRQLHAAREAGRDWAYTGSVNVDEHGRTLSGRPPLPPHAVADALLRYNAIPGGGSNVVVRRTTWLKAGPFDTRLRNTEDWEMWIRLAKLGLPAWVRSPLLAYRVHVSNSSLDASEIVRGARLIEAMHHTAADWGRLHRWLGQSCLRRGERLAALDQFARAAVRGEARLALSDIVSHVRRGVARRLGSRAADGAVSADPWIQTADEWLKEFRPSDTAAGDGVRITGSETRRSAG